MVKVGDGYMLVGPGVAPTEPGTAPQNGAAFPAGGPPGASAPGAAPPTPSSLPRLGDGAALPGEAVLPDFGTENARAATLPLEGSRTILVESVGEAPPGTLRIAGYLKVQLDDLGMPSAHATSVWAGFQEAQPTFPLTRTLTVPTDGRTWLLAFIDTDGDERVDPGERASSPIAPLPATAEGAPAPPPYVLRLDRDATGPVGVEGYGRWARWHAILDGDADTLAAGDAALILVGYAPTDVSEEGYPHRTARPMLQFSVPKGPRSWPEHLDFSVPEGQTPILFAIQDLNADGHMSPGDRLGTTGTPIQAPAPTEGVRVVVDQVLPGGESAPERAVQAAGCGS